MTDKIGGDKKKPEKMVSFRRYSSPLSYYNFICLYLVNVAGESRKITKSGTSRLKIEKRREEGAVKDFFV